MITVNKNQKYTSSLYSYTQWQSVQHCVMVIKKAQQLLFWAYVPEDTPHL